MTMRMLIDARHPEETRVAVVKGNRIEEFDFESAEHKQLKGNIYLAKVTRVEPSLQAAFVDYGGNRHGFLAFSEIHPDYYQIPKEDRDALLREEAEHAEEEARLRDEDQDLEPLDEHHDDDGQDNDRPDSDLELDSEEEVEAAEGVGGDSGHDDHEGSALRAKRHSIRRRYKIQDVIHRRQVLLVQVVKEERGNKGAALTSYLSLAGRYCVLMPNSTHGGGISRKISNVTDRKRLKSIMSDLDLPKSMGCIVRTAGLSRTKTEIKRDFDYLARLWDDIRELTLKSSAPALIHNDSNLIKRAIRDIYNRDIEEVIVEGEHGFKAARDFMKLLMPSHAKKVRPYADTVALYQRYGVEDQLNAMYQPVVQLKSGGYLVINPTEALVSIDINSGRSTREHGIEQTAVATNLEAAHEIARQLRLRDMAGLVVIDFIDMEHNSNIRKVEKAMKSALADDRARIQIGRISSFGLMEMSRQRLRTGVLEASTRECPHCEGTGLVRTASSAAISALRMLEDEAARGRSSRIMLRASQEAAFYLLNRKRAELSDIEERYGVIIEILSDGEVEGARMTVEGSGPPPEVQVRLPEPMVFDDDVDDIPDDEEEEIEEEREEEAEDRSSRNREGSREDGGRKRGRRRRGRRGRREEGESGSDGESETNAESAPSEAPSDEGTESTEAGEDGAKPRSRRGRRGGRRRRGESGEAIGDETPANGGASSESLASEGDPITEAEGESAPVEVKPARRRSKKAETAAEPEIDAVVEPVAEIAAEKPKRTRKAKVVEAPVEDAAALEPEPAAEETPAKPKRGRARKADPVAEAALAATVDEEPARRGWWQRTFGAGEGED
jgi:ribonuclease E